MKTAYYSRNDSFSRSFNAEVAESENRLPRSRAAAFCGLSVAAFDAGCRAVGYSPSEWHHVGKFAARVDYYDCEELASQPEFWAGAAASYKSAKKRAEVLATVARWAEAERAAEVERFRARLIRQRDCTRPVARHNSRDRWHQRCRRARISPATPLGDVAAFRAAVAVRRQRDAEVAERAAQRERDKAELAALLAAHFAVTTDDWGRDCHTLDGNLCARQHAGGVNIWHRQGGQSHQSISAAAALEILRKKVARA